MLPQALATILALDVSWNTSYLSLVAPPTVNGLGGTFVPTGFSPHGVVVF